MSAKLEEIIVRASGVEIFDMDEEKKERETSEDERYLRLQENFSMYLAQYGFGVIEAINEAISVIDAISVKAVKIQYSGRIGRIGD